MRGRTTNAMCAMEAQCSQCPHDPRHCVHCENITPIAFVSKVFASRPTAAPAATPAQSCLRPDMRRSQRPLPQYKTASPRQTPTSAPQIAASTHPARGTPRSPQRSCRSPAATERWKNAPAATTPTCPAGPHACGSGRPESVPAPPARRRWVWPQPVSQPRAQD